MPLIELTTTIHAPIERCFDLARSIDLHRISMGGTGEEAIAGVTSGLIGVGEQVTWRATHYGVTQRLTSKITQFDRPKHFRDEMIKGTFKMIQHDHWFESTTHNKTVMTDHFRFETPGWILGTLFNKLMLEKYLRRLLDKRNNIIKKVAEGQDWKSILKK